MQNQVDCLSQGFKNYRQEFYSLSENVSPSYSDPLLLFTCSNPDFYYWVFAMGY